MAEKNPGTLKSDRSAWSLRQKEVVCNYPTGFVQQQQQYRCESGLLDAVHVRPGIGHHDVLFSPVANSAVHQRLAEPKVGADRESWTLDARHSRQTCRKRHDSLCRSWRGSSEGWSRPFPWHRWWASGRSGGRGTAHQSQTAVQHTHTHIETPHLACCLQRLHSASFFIFLKWNWKLGQTKCVGLCEMPPSLQRQWRQLWHHRGNLAGCLCSSPSRI